jgi:hypothetical protein
MKGLSLPEIQFENNKGFAVLFLKEAYEGVDLIHTPS